MTSNILRKIFVLLAMLAISACSQRAVQTEDDSAQLVNPAPASSALAPVATLPASIEQPLPQSLPALETEQPDATNEPLADEEQSIPFEEELEEHSRDFDTPESVTDQTVEPVGNILKLPL